MKKRPKYFLSEENISHDSEVFDYIKELHSNMWEVVKYLDCDVSIYLCECWEKLMEKIKEVNL